MRALVFGEGADPAPPAPEGEPRLVRHLASTPMALRDVPDPELRGPAWTVLRIGGGETRTLSAGIHAKLSGWCCAH